MRFSKTKPFILVVALMALALTSKSTAHEVKADAAIKDQPSVVVRSVSLNSDKVIKVPERNTQKTSTKTSTSKQTTLSRGRNGLNQAGPTAPAGSNNVVTYAYKFLGRPYIWGASGPNAFDCSGFTSYVYRAFGVSLDHYTGSQFGRGQAVGKGNLSQGDLVFFNTYGSISHVGIYIGNGNFIHAANSRTGVIVSSLSEGYYASHYAGAKRVLK
jgi:cell wall-associated NlpC family hydrolase